MAIQVNGTQVIGNSRELTNIASVDATTAAAITAAGVGGGGIDGTIGGWQMVQGNISGTLNAVAWSQNGSQFVTAGSNGIVRTSPDGVTWTSRNSNGTGSNYFVLVNTAGNRWVIGGSDGWTFDSTDGVTWTKRFNTGYTLNGGFWDGTYFYVGAYGRLFRSSNGTSWTTIINSPMDIKDFVSNGSGLLVAVGNNISGNTWIQTSTNNGSTWTARAISGNPNLFDYTDVAYNGSNLYVAGGYAGQVATSTNGTSWTWQGYIHPGTVNDLLWDGSQFVTSGGNGKVSTSTDGVNWKTIVAGNVYDKNTYGITKNADVYVLVGAVQNIFVTAT